MYKDLQDINFMVDIETLGIRPNSIITDIAVVLFDQIGAVALAEYHISENTQQDRLIDQGTLDWRLAQGWKRHDELRYEITLTQALLKLNAFVESLSICGTPIMWAKGTDFDFAFLYHAMRSREIVPFWKYNNVQDYRTLARRFPEVPEPVNMNKHNALSDAVCQATHCTKILGHIRKLQNA